MPANDCARQQRTAARVNKRKEEGEPAWLLAIRPARAHHVLRWHRYQERHGEEGEGEREYGARVAATPWRQEEGNATAYWGLRREVNAASA